MISRPTIYNLKPLHLPKHAMHNNRCECRGNARRMAQNDIMRLTGRRGQWKYRYMSLFFSILVVRSTKATARLAKSMR